jgi:stalled ribosome rescue protein Dom34
MTNLNPRPVLVAATSRTSDDAALTPTARRELAAGALLSALDGYVREVLSGVAGANEWVDQHASPLGKRAHMEAVRRGDLRGVKHGRRILVRRAELNSFLEHRSVMHHAVRNGSDDAADAVRADEVATALLTHVGLRRRKG